MHTSRRGEGRECGQLCYGPSRFTRRKGLQYYLRYLPPFTHTSAWRWPSRTLPSTRSALASRRTGSRTAAGRSTCEQKGERSGACESPALLCNLAFAWLVGPSALLHEGGWGYAQGKLEILIALDRDRADLAAHDRMRDLARTAHPRAGRRRTWDRGAARGGAGRRRAARGGVAGRRTLQGRSSREYRT